MENQKVDFVITWVDGSDKNWVDDYNKYSSNPIDECRYRDWGLLKYWFRAVEKYASWVNKIYFVTWGHVPEWLNLNCEKIVVVNHSDFIPKKYLPTFNSCVIEANLHNIKDLSDYFVYFNDDMFINDFVKIEDFFVNGLPCDNKRFKFLQKRGKNSTYINLNCFNIVDKYFNIDYKYNYTFFEVLKRIIFFNCESAVSFIPDHVPTAYRKQTFIEVWDKEFSFLDEMCFNKFRTNNDVSQWLFQFWQIGSGNYIDRNNNISKYYEINSNTILESINDIKYNKHKLICINDAEITSDIELNKNRIIMMFEDMFPEKSFFEK